MSVPREQDQQTPAGLQSSQVEGQMDSSGDQELAYVMLRAI